MTPIPCTRVTRNNPGCRCADCLASRAEKKRLIAHERAALHRLVLRVRRQNAAMERAIAREQRLTRQRDEAIAVVRKQEQRKRAAPWEGRGKRE